MSDKQESNRPSHAIYVIQGEGKKERWTRIGAAWQHKDKQGFNLAFEAYPAGNGRVTLRVQTEKDDAQTQPGTGGQQ